MTHSSASSECGEDFIDVGVSEYDFYQWSEPAEYLQSSSVEVLDWQDCGSNDVGSVTSQSYSDIGEQASSQRQDRGKFDDLFNINKWSDLTYTEQVKIIEDLTQIVSSQMGLREQLNIIRIIDPSAVVSKTATEFAIDMNCINDEKWQAIKELMNSKTNNTKLKKTVNRSRNNQISHRRNTNKSPLALKNKLIKRTNKQTQSQINVIREEDRKKERQKMKEHRSGLFKKNQILCLTYQQLEEEFIDILD